MALIGYHASHEQFAPSELLRLVRMADEAGFQGAMCSDHLFPWSEAQGHSGFAWSWLGAALQATDLDFGVVTSPGQRYHPVIIAQAAATLAEMFPRRFWIAMGSGENLNEHVTGDEWPPKDDRNERLKECAHVMQALWRGEWVTHRGHVRVEGARVYSLPETPPQMVGAALTPKTAEWLGGWGEGLITASKPLDLLEEIVSAFRRGGGVGKPMYLQVKVACGRDTELAVKQAHEQWKTNILASPLLADGLFPETFEAAAQFVRPEDMDGPVMVSSDPEEHLQRMKEYEQLGFERIYIHEVTLNQQAMIELYGGNVIPAFRRDPNPGKSAT